MKVFRDNTKTWCRIAKQFKEHRIGNFLFGIRMGIRDIVSTIKVWWEGG